MFLYSCLRLLHHYKLYFLGELALLVKQEGKLKGPRWGGTLEYVSSCREIASLLLVMLACRVTDGLSVLLGFP